MMLGTKNRVLIGCKWIIIGVPVRALAPSGFTEAETIVLTSLTS